MTAIERELIYQFVKKSAKPYDIVTKANGKIFLVGKGEKLEIVKIKDELYAKDNRENYKLNVKTSIVLNNKIGSLFETGNLISFFGVEKRIDKAKTPLELQGVVDDFINDEELLHRQP